MRIYQFDHKEIGVNERIRFKFLLLIGNCGTSVENDRSIYNWWYINSWIMKPPVCREFKYIKD
jgi:hypothetical protein